MKSTRLTTRITTHKSEEFATDIRPLVKEKFHIDLFETNLDQHVFGYPKDHEWSVTLVETMGDQKEVVGFIIPDSTHRTLHHAYSLSTHEMAYAKKSKDAAVIWVKKQYRTAPSE